MDKIEEEVREVRLALTSSTGETQRRVEAEFGDLLFALVNLARFLKVNPEDALRGATNRFTERFQQMEAEATRSGRTLDSMSLAELDALWENAKQKRGTGLSCDA